MKLKGESGDPEKVNGEWPREEFLRYRETLINLSTEQSRSFDKHVIALASGGIILSVVILRDVLADKPDICFSSLYFGWIFFALSLLSTLVSFQIAKVACDKELAWWDEQNSDECCEKDDNTRNRYTTATTFLNVLSLVSFALALIAMFVFTASNIK